MKWFGKKRSAEKDAGHFERSAYERATIPDMLPSSLEHLESESNDYYAPMDIPPAGPENIEPKFPNPSPSQGLLKAAGGDGLSRSEKLRLAEGEVDEAEVLVRLTREQLAKWEKTLLFRKETLERIRES